MYKIISMGKVLALCDKPRFVRKKALTGAWVVTDEETAEAVAVRGTVYALEGKPAVRGAQLAKIVPVEGGEFLFDEVGQRVKISDHKADLAALEDAMCELDVSDQVAALEDALCEIDMGRE